MIFRAYKEFAIKNRPFIQSVESLLSLNTYLLISPNNEIRSQCAYTLLMLWSLFHEERIWKPHQDAQLLNNILQSKDGTFLQQVLQSLYPDKFKKALHTKSQNVFHLGEVSKSYENDRKDILNTPEGDKYKKLTNDLTIRSQDESISQISSSSSTLNLDIHESNLSDDSLNLSTNKHKDDLLDSNSNNSRKLQADQGKDNHYVNRINRNFEFKEKHAMARVIQKDKKLISKLIRNDKRFPGETSIQFLKVIELTEMLLEMMVQSKVGKRNKWLFVMLLEIIKSLTKTWQVITSKASVSLHHSVLPSKVDLWTKETNWTALRGKRTNTVLTQHPSYLLYLPPSLKDFLRSPWDRVLWHFSELMHIWRPVIYVGLIMHFYYSPNIRRTKFTKYAKWIPWLISFIIDTASLRISKHLVSKSEYNTSTIHAELTRRRQNMLSYMVRNPFFNVFIKPFVQWMCDRLKRVPIASFILANVAEYLLTLQTYYFCTSAS